MQSLGTGHRRQKVCRFPRSFGRCSSGKSCRDPVQSPRGARASTRVLVGGVSAPVPTAQPRPARRDEQLGCHARNAALRATPARCRIRSDRACSPQGSADRSGRPHRPSTGVAAACRLCLGEKPGRSAGVALGPPWSRGARGPALSTALRPAGAAGSRAAPPADHVAVPVGGGAHRLLARPAQQLVGPEPDEGLDVDLCARVEERQAL